jgi:type II secretory pathway pseudopilin PulG
MTRRLQGHDNLRRCAHACDGFTLVELMVATAVFMLFTAVAVLGISEAQRGVNTFVARETDTNEAQATVNLAMELVRQAQSAAVYGCTSGTSSEQCAQLWLYNPTPPSNWPYACTVWAYNGTASPPELDMFGFSTADLPVQLSTPTVAQLATVATARSQLPGVEPLAGLSEPFRTFSGYPGLVDLSLEAQYSTVAAASSTQQASSPVELETEADDVNISAASGLPSLSATSPSTQCY